MGFAADCGAACARSVPRVHVVNNQVVAQEFGLLNSHFLLAQYAGVNGFLGTRASLMLDLVFLAMFAVVPILFWSVILAKRGNYVLHKRVQLALALILLIAVTTFEVEMRIFGWEERAELSPYWSGPEWNDAVHYSLGVHLFFAIPTALLWIYVVVRAMRRFPNPVAPNEHSRSHRFWAPIATLEMLMTAVTGWVFYWLAFAAT